MLQPPGALLRYPIGGWPKQRQRQLIRDLSLSAHGFQKLLLGAHPLLDDQVRVISRASGVPESTFQELEHEFTEWSTGVRPTEGYASGLLKEDNVEERFTAQEITRRVAALALEMTSLPQKGVLLVPILKGAFIFSADLIRYLFMLGIDPFVEFLQLNSYPDRDSRLGGIRSSRALANDAVIRRTVLIVDDICDTGATLDFARNQALSSGAEQVFTCVLIDKTERRAPHLRNFAPDYVGFTVSRAGWMVGYGMDEKGRFRGSPEVGELSLYPA